MTTQPLPHLDPFGYQRALPSAALRDVVQWFWTMASDGTVATPRDEFMHPDGSLGLAFNWGDALDLSGDAAWQDVALNGIRVQSLRVQLSGKLNTFGILFQPGGAFEAFGVPLSQLTDVDVLTDLVGTQPLADLHAQLFAAGDFRQRIALAEAWLTRYLARGQANSPLIAPSLGLLARSHGQVPIANLSDTLAVSPRQLERLFKTQIGLTPKQMARLYRVRLARGLLKQSPTGSLADVAYRCGFYDQAHFIRDFRAVTGMTPGAYQARHLARQADDAT